MHHSNVLRSFNIILLFLQILKREQSGAPTHPEKERYTSTETLITEETGRKRKKKKRYNAVRHSTGNSLC